MDRDEAFSLFSLAKGRPLQATLRRPNGTAWATDMPILFPRVLPDQYGEAPVIRLSSTDTDTGFYTDFFVESASQDDKGNLVLTDPTGKTATIKVGK